MRLRIGNFSGRASVVSYSVRGFVLAAALALSGCVSYRDIGSDVRLSSPDEVGYTRSLESAGTADARWPTDLWWQRFNDPQLSSMIKEALTNNPTMAEAAARVRLARAQMEVRQAIQSPRLDMVAEVFGEHYSENGLTPTPFAGSFQKTGDLSLQAEYQLDFWGRNRALIHASQSRLAAAEAEAAGARLLLADAVATTYFELAQWQAIRRVALNALEQRQHIVDLTRQRVEAGLDNKVALRQAETQVPLTRALLAQVEEMVEITEHGLAALAGRGPDRTRHLDAMTARLPEGDIQVPDNLPLELLGRRPDLVAARWQVEAGLHSIDATKAEFYPNVNLRAFVGFSSIGLDNLVKSASRTYGVGPAFSLPVFDGDRLRGELKADYARFDQAVAIYNQCLVEALRDVADQISHQRALQPQIEQQQLAYDSAKRALDLALERYQAGLGTYLTVLNAESVVIQQKVYRIQLRQRALAVQVDLIRALGGGFEAGRSNRAEGEDINPISSKQQAAKFTIPGTAEQSADNGGRALESEPVTLSSIGVNHE